MEKAIAGSVDALLAQGVLGVVAIAQALLIWFLWRAYQKQNERIDAIQEKRVAEGRESVKALEANTNSIENITEVMRLSRSA